MNCFIGAEISNCKVIEDYVGRSSSLSLVKTCTDAVAIREQLSVNGNIDLYILDAEVPGLDLFSLISNLDYHPNIIIIASGVQNALRAFDFNIVDYLLKPLSYARFCKAVDKAIRYHSHVEINNSGENEIFIKKGASLVKIKLKEIIFIEALENYVILNTKDEKYTIHFTMKAIEMQLPSGIFMRVHRSFIVNKSMIQNITDNTIEIKVGRELKYIPLGKSFREPLLNNIKVMGK